MEQPVNEKIDIIMIVTATLRLDLTLQGGWLIMLVLEYCQSDTNIKESHSKTWFENINLDHSESDWIEVIRQPKNGRMCMTGGC